jgi:hypothetical protein
MPDCKQYGGITRAELVNLREEKAFLYSRIGNLENRRCRNRSLRRRLIFCVFLISNENMFVLFFVGHFVTIFLI